MKYVILTEMKVKAAMRKISTHHNSYAVIYNPVVGLQLQ